MGRLDRGHAIVVRNELLFVLTKQLIKFKVIKHNKYIYHVCECVRMTNLRPFVIRSCWLYPIAAGVV